MEIQNFAFLFRQYSARVPNIVIKTFFFKVKSGEVKTCVKFLISLLDIRR